MHRPAARWRSRALAIACIAVVGCTVAGCASHAPFIAEPADSTPPSPAAIDHRVILIGDAGDPDPNGEPTLHALEKQVERMPASTTVVYLGDNVYETGMPEPTPMEGTVTEEILDEALLNLYASRRDSERRVKAQVKAVDVRGARGIFIPGNHDWDQFGIGGWKRIRELERYIRDLSRLTKGRIELLPTGGCPGPVTVDAGRHARLVILDTQWWLEQGQKPAPEDNPTACPYVTEDAVLEALREALRDAARADRAAIVVAHHPLESRGPHGGYVSPRVHLFPFVMFGSYVPTVVHWIPIPVLGTIMGEGRAWLSPNPQDMSSIFYEHMRSRLVDAMEAAAQEGAAPLVYAAGHEHSLQVFEGERGPRYTVVSGLGSHEKALPVGKAWNSLFAHSSSETPGFVTLDVLRDGRVRLGVVEATRDAPDGREVWAHRLVEAPARARARGETAPIARAPSD
jgi:hypothetical protein